MKHAIHYRPDIDGLRALAILPVVLFHLDPAIIPGGYVGVDIFFVISGFLITSIVYREIHAGRFSFALFYERRIRRLMPALTAVLAASFVAAWLLLLPRDFRSFSEALAAASLFLANIFFWKKTDYFSDPVDSLPLLHTWSLAVEEQFYIFFPPLLLLILRRHPAHLNKVLIVLFALSLAWAEHTLKIRPESAFYLPHLRAWELIAGAILATGAIPEPRSRTVKNLLALAGLAMIAGSLFALDKHSSFPGIAALPPVIGAVLIIHSSRHTSTYVGKLLSWKPLVMIGLLSYSLYLWHWPLFVFVRYYLPPLQPSVLVDGMLLTLAIALAGLSWRFIERPFRHHGDRLRRRRLYTVAAISISLPIALALPGILTHGAAFRIPAEVARIAETAKEQIPYRRPCFGLTPRQIEDGKSVCTMGSGRAPEFLLWGDSHALALAHGVDLASRELSIAGHFLGLSACPPAAPPDDQAFSRGHCTKFNDAVRAHLRRHASIRTVILAGYWSIYYRHKTELPFEAGLVQLLKELAADGYRVVVINQVPEVGWDVPSVLAKSLLFGHTPPPAPELRTHYERLARFQELIADIGPSESIRFVDLSPALCPASQCLANHGDTPLYRDSHHLSQYGSTQLKDSLLTSLRPYLTP